MWWSDGTRPTRRAALLGLALLAGCGFTPLYDPGGAGSALSGRVALELGDGVADYRLRARLEERLGQATTPTYGLAATLTYDQRPAALTGDGATTRYAVTGQADWRLTRLSDGATLGQGTVDSFTGYSATGTTVATRAAEEAARDRLSIILADLLVTRLYALSLAP